MRKMILMLAGMFLLAVSGTFARDAVFNGDDYTITVKYNDQAYPGDAVFVRMAISQTGKQNKNMKLKLTECSARLELFLGEKRLDKADFYAIESDSSKNCEILLAGIPLSSWWNSDNDYSLKVTYTLSTSRTYDFMLPFGLNYKKFNSETIPLDSRNTSIKTDTSPRRMAQIDKLNGILGTINSDHVYQTTAFTAPTTATRRTSYFADRRVYSYTNGKSSTSLHYGTDYGIPEGSEVRTCAGGRVVMAENRISTGWSVVVEHLPGLYSLYYHMSALKVKEGDMVKMGDLIGLSGATGLATGPHLHWEMRLNMSAVNPDFFVHDFTFAATN